MHDHQIVVPVVVEIRHHRAAAGALKENLVAPQ
jgi:hypothetical protein